MLDEHLVFGGSDLDIFSHPRTGYNEMYFIMAKKKHSHVLRGIAPACSGILAAGLNGLLILSTKVRLKQEPTLAPLKDGTRALC